MLLGCACSTHHYSRRTLSSNLERHCHQDGRLTPSIDNSRRISTLQAVPRISRALHVAHRGMNNPLDQRERDAPPASILTLSVQFAVALPPTSPHHTRTHESVVSITAYLTCDERIHNVYNIHNSSASIHIHVHIHKVHCSMYPFRIVLLFFMPRDRVFICLGSICSPVTRPTCYKSVYY